jgi:hypothetical protein
MEYSIDRQDCASTVIIGYFKELGDGDMDLRDFDGSFRLYFPGPCLALF